MYQSGVWSGKFVCQFASTRTTSTCVAFNNAQVLWAKGSRLQSCPTRGTRIRSSSGLSRAFPLNCPRGNWKFKFIWQRTW